MLGEIKPGDDLYYLLGLDIIGQEEGSAWHYFGYDSLGSVRFMTDAGGIVDNVASYDPYGSPLEQYISADTNLGFTGEYTDASGLLYLRARYASLSTASFLTLDPVLGAYRNLSASWNGYGYAHGNPVNLTDFTGKFPGLALPALAPFAVPLAAGATAALFVCSLSQSCREQAAAALEELLNRAIRGAGNCADLVTDTVEEIIKSLSSPSVRPPLSNPVPGMGRSEGVPLGTPMPPFTGGIHPPDVDFSSGGFSIETPQIGETIVTTRVNLPSWKTIKIDVEHITSGHRPGGSRLMPDSQKDLFPADWSDRQIENAVRMAYKNGKRVGSQSGRVVVEGTGGGRKIRMYVNIETRTIETAFPAD